MLATHPPPHTQQPSDTELPSSPSADDTSPPAPCNANADADDDTDPTGLPSLLYDDIDHPATSATTLLLTAQHNHTTQQLQHTITQLTQQLATTTQQLLSSQRQTDKYRAQCAVFVRNLSVLYETAVSEVRRKQEEVDRLKEWKATQERRTRMIAATVEKERQQQLTNGGQVQYGVGVTVSGSAFTQQLPPPPVKRAHHSMQPPFLPQPPFPPPDSARKRARVDTG